MGQDLVGYATPFGGQKASAAGEEQKKEDSGAATETTHNLKRIRRREGLQWRNVQQRRILWQRKLNFIVESSSVLGI